MRRHGSIISQLLIAFCIAAVLIAGAGIGGYIAAAQQAAAVKQFTAHYQVLQSADDQLAANFTAAAFAAHDYALTGDGRFLRPLASLQANFDSYLATLRRETTPDLRGLVAAQARTGTVWFDLMPEIVAVTPHTRAARKLLDHSADLAHGFVAANIAMQDRLDASVSRLSETARRTFSLGLILTAVALAVAVLLVLAASLSALYTVTRPLRALAATVQRLTGGDHAARALLAGSAEVRAVARVINAQADESDRLRAQEAENTRLRTLAREAGLRIREHLVAADVIDEASAALQQMVDADWVYLRLLEDERLGSPFGRVPDFLRSADVIGSRLTPDVVEELNEAFRTQASMVMRDVQGEGGNQIPPGLREMVRRMGVASQLLTPFGVGTELLGLVIAQRLDPDRTWTAVEVDAVESIAADLGRGLNQAHLYEAENRLVSDLRTLDRAKSDFFATISHELRAPLTTIEGYVEMLGDGEAGSITPQQRKMLETIDRSSVRLRNLIEDLFTLSKLESGTLTAVMRPVNVAELIAGAVDAVRPSVAAGKLTLAYTPPDEKPMTAGDASQLDRVLANMLSNAVKFTPPGGHIDVTVTTDGKSVAVSVRDTGIGIPERDQQELFSRFFRASNATARRIPGTGLGLAIVHMIVGHHGGEVTIKSQEGAGTTVTVRLPLVVPVASRGAAADGRTRATGPA